MNERSRAVQEQIERALGGEQAQRRPPTAQSGHRGVAVAGSGNTVNYYDGGPGGPGKRSLTGWKRVWALLAVIFFAAGLWLQVDQTVWQATAGEPGAHRLFETLRNGGQAIDVFVPAFSAAGLASVLTLGIYWLSRRF